MGGYAQNRKLKQGPDMTIAVDWDRNKSMNLLIIYKIYIKTMLLRAATNKTPRNMSMKCIPHHTPLLYNKHRGIFLIFDPKHRL